jgi:hypothetical protein
LFVSTEPSAARTSGIRVILGRDQLDAALLPLLLARDRREHVRIITPQQRAVGFKTDVHDEDDSGPHVD